MALLVPNGIEGEILKYVLNITAPENLSIRLYTNNITPAETDTVGTYTEATGGGYTSKPLVPGSWVITLNNPAAQATHPQIVWTFTGVVGNVYGYFVTRDTSNDLMWSERFTNGPYNVQNNGDEVKVTPRSSLE